MQHVVCVAGSREFRDASKLREVMAKVHDRIVSAGYTPKYIGGGAEGADKLGKEWAVQHGFDYTEFPANWKEHGRAAGPIRNRQMAAVAQELIAFWDGKSPGTGHMIASAKRHGIPVQVIYF